MSRIHVSFVILCVAALSACGGVSDSGGDTDPGQPPPTDSISGTVSFKGAPLAGAAVTDFLTNNNIVFKTAITDANGNYSFSGMQSSGDAWGEYQIYVNKTGYAFYPSVREWSESHARRLHRTIRRQRSASLRIVFHGARFHCLV